MFCTATCEVFIEPPPDTQRTERQGERGIWVAMGCYLVHVTPPPLPPPSPLPTLRVCRTACGHVIWIRGMRESPPPPPHSPKRIMARSRQPRSKSRTASIPESVSMVAEFGQQQWSCTNFQGSDRTPRSRDRIFDFSQEMVKICASAENRTTAEILIGRAGTTSRYSTGPSDHLRSTCLRINTIYEDLNESSSARLGGSQQFEILPSPNKRAPNFSA